MLTHLHIQNFVIIEQLSLDFSNGLTVITGETGSGKSIIIDALSLILGDRADPNMIGSFQSKCDLSASFTLDNIPAAQSWLLDNDYATQASNECLLRRILHKDGKARQTINGHQCTLQQLREFVPHLIQIHCQNQHHLLSKQNHQRYLLDQFGMTFDLVDQVKKHYSDWAKNQQWLATLEQQQTNFAVQCDLLNFQITEFEKLSLAPQEYEQLDIEHKQLANAEQHIRTCHAALDLLAEGEINALNLLYRALQSLTSLSHLNEKVVNSITMLNDALVQTEESVSELSGFLKNLSVNPERLNTIERRLSKIYDLARKYAVSPTNLWKMQIDLQQQLATLLEVREQMTAAQEQNVTLWNDYLEAAKKLDLVRQKTASKLNKVIKNALQNLGMPGGDFCVKVTWREEPTPQGCNQIDFLIQTNLGHELQPLSKVASGGEMSRIALAIYVATAQKNTTPILVFDEVDVGIGGGTAAVVGERLKLLGQVAQVICITHLPQVAAYGDHHLCVSKQVINNQSQAQIHALSAEERVKEIARMLGGMKITKRTLEHAKELISLQ